MSLTINGVNIEVMQNQEVVEEIISALDPAAILQFDVNAINHSLNSLPIRYPPPLAPIQFGVLHWPSDASRFATFHVLVDDATLTALRGASFGLFGSNGPQLQQVIMSDESGGTIKVVMYPLPPRPIAQILGTLTLSNGQTQVINPASGYNGLYLLTLVDLRYFWWQQSASFTVNVGVTTWADLFSAISSALPAAGFVADSVLAAYGKPSSRWQVYQQPIPLYLDALAYTVGMRVCVTLAADGTGIVRVQSTSTAQTSHNTSLGNASYSAAIGGWVYQQGKTNAQALHGGGVFFASDLNQSVPSSVTLWFSSTNSLLGAQVIAGYTQQVTLASLLLSQFIGVTGYSGSKVIVGDLTATGTGGTPTNLTALTSYANQAATDWYVWQLGNVDLEFAGIVPWTPSAWIDEIIWYQRGGKSERPIPPSQMPDNAPILPGACVATRVLRKPWNDRELGCINQTPGGVIVELPNTTGRQALSATNNLLIFGNGAIGNSGGAVTDQDAWALQNYTDTSGVTGRLAFLKTSSAVNSGIIGAGQVQSNSAYPGSGEKYSQRLYGNSTNSIKSADQFASPILSVLDPGVYVSGTDGNEQVLAYMTASHTGAYFQTFMLNTSYYEALRLTPSPGSGGIPDTNSFLMMGIPNTTITNKPFTTTSEGFIDPGVNGFVGFGFFNNSTQVIGRSGQDAATGNYYSGGLLTQWGSGSISLVLNVTTITGTGSGSIGLLYNNAGTLTQLVGAAGTLPVFGSLTAQTMSGDVTNNSSLAVTIGNNKVTYAKMQQASTVTLLGNPTGGTANISEITLGSGLAFSGTTLTASGSGGTVTSITAGTGLTGGTITTSGTIALSVPVSVANGGTGSTTLTAHNVLLGEGTSALAFAAPGTAGNLLLSQGASADPSFNAISQDASVTNAGVWTNTGLRGISISTAIATLLSQTNGATTRNATATLVAGEQTVFTGSTAAQTLTLPATPQVSSINTIENLASVNVTLAAGAGNTLNFNGTVGSIAVVPNSSVEIVFIGTVWYVIGFSPAYSTGLSLTGLTLTSTGFTSPMTTLGDIIYENAVPAAARLAGNTTTTKNFLTQTGNGSISAAPAWGTIATGDLPALDGFAEADWALTDEVIKVSSGHVNQWETVARLGGFLNPGLFGHRISPSSSAAVVTTDQSSVTTVYLIPSMPGHDRFCLNDGTRWLEYVQTSALQLFLAGMANGKIYDILLSDASVATNAPQYLGTTNFQAVNNSTLTVSRTAGQFLVMIAFKGTSTTLGTVSGWGSPAFTSGNIQVYTKTAAGSSADNFIVPNISSSVSCKLVYFASGASIDTTANGSGSGTSLTGSSVTPGEDTSVLISGFTQNAASATITLGSSFQVDTGSLTQNNGGQPQTCVCGIQILGGTGSVTSSANSGTSAAWSSINIVVKASGGSGPVLELSPAWQTNTGRFTTGTYTTLPPTQNGIYVRSTDGTTVDKTKRVIATVLATSGGTTQMLFNPAGASGGSAPVLGIYNFYNQVPIKSRCYDSNGSWNYTTATWRSADGNNNNRITWIDGLGIANVKGVYSVNAFQSAAGIISQIGMNFNSTTAAPNAIGSNVTNSTIVSSQITVEDFFQGALGSNYCQAMERSSGSTTTFNTFLSGQSNSEYLMIELMM